MKTLLKYIYAGFFVGLVLSVVFLGLEALSRGELVWDLRLLERFMGHMVYSIILTALNGTYFSYLHRTDVFKNLSWWSLLGSILGSILLTVFGLFVAEFILQVLYSGLSWEAFVGKQRLLNYVIGILVTTVVTLFFHVLHFYREWQEKRVRIHKQMAGTASARFEALKNQLDPHFLFNSLNVLSSLIEEDQRQAQKFTTSLSKVYRYVLEQKNKDLVTLEDELNFARTYTQLLEMRFEDSITFRLPAQAHNPGAKMVPLSLQLLLENAVKHNVVSTVKPLTIEVVEDNDRLVVSNNLQEKYSIGRGSGVGLKNIQQRYELLTTEAVRIEKDNGRFTVSLPLLDESLEVEAVPDNSDFLSRKRYEKAVGKVEELKRFYGHLISYCIVIPALWALNLLTSPFLWAIFPTLGWGLGLARHAMAVFDYNFLWGKKWEERKIRELMDKGRY